MALSLLSVLGPSHPMMQREEVDSHVRMELSRRKQKNPRSIAVSDSNECEREWEEGSSPTTDMCDMVKVEIHNGSSSPPSPERRQTPSSPRSSHLFPPMEDLVRKCNLVPFGEVTVPNHPNTPPIPMSIPMTYLFPVSKDPVTGEAKYKMLVPRNGGGDPSMVGGFPPMIPFPSPPLLPHMIPLPPLHRPETEPTPDKSKKSKIPPKTREIPQESSLKVEVKEGSDISAPLDLTHRSPNSSSDLEEDSKVETSPRKEGITESSKSPEQKFGPEIEAQLNFLKVKQMEFLKQAAESAVVNRCNECNINFSKYQNYVAHKKYYCSGQKQTPPQDSDDDSSPSSSSSKAKVPLSLPSSSSPPVFPTSSQAASSKTIFPREFFLSQKSLLDQSGGGPGSPKLPPGLLLPGSLPLPPPPPSSHFICQGCGIKFKSISNLQAHQSRYCAGIKTAEDSCPVSPGQPSLESLLRSGVAMGGAGPVSAADMMTFLSAQQHIKAETVETDKCAPATSPEARDTEGSEDFCCILCGFKESSVDKLKDHINMHFIGQVKKRKSENDGVSEEESQGQNKVKEATVKKVKLETQVGETESSLEMESETDPLSLESPGSGAGGIPVSGGGSQVSVKTGNGLVVTGTKTGTKSSLPTVTKSSLTCTNCDISFVNPSTYNAHVQFYCKNKEGSH